MSDKLNNLSNGNIIIENKSVGNTNLLLDKIDIDKFKETENKYLSRKKDFYRIYFEDQRKNYPKNLVKITLMGYLGGCFFGVIMLAFSMLGSTRFDQSMASLKYEESLYKNLTEFKAAMKQVSIIC